MSPVTADGPVALVVMGVSGSGKTTIAALLAGRLGWAFADGDDFHPPANVEKMRAGTPLTDDDRRPWLKAIAGWIGELRDRRRHGVVACSALRRAYRDLLGAGAADVRLVYLAGDEALIGRRQAARHGHFMPTSQMRDQFATLEAPVAEERPITVSVANAPAVIVDDIIRQLAAVP